MVYRNKDDWNKYLEETKEHRLEQMREYHWKNRDEILERQHKRLEKHREENKKKCKENYLNNREERLRKMAEYRNRNYDKILELNRKYQQENYDRVLEINRNYSRSPAGRIADAKKYNRRKRKLGFNILFENRIVDEEITWHHVTDKDVVALPKDLHAFFSGNPTKNHRENLNPIVKQFYPDYAWDG